MGLYKKWTEEEENNLRQFYPSYKCKDLEILFGRKIGAITKRAEILGVKRLTRQVDLINSTLSVLLEDRNEVYYWIGFLMADGHFSPKNELRLLLAELDINHLRKFAILINKTIHRPRKVKDKLYYTVSAMDNYVLPKIKEKFDLKNDKTYNPPRLEIFEKMTDEQFISWFIGFIDGDGNIKHQTERKDIILQLGNHMSWQKQFDYILNRVGTITGIKSNSKTYIRLEKGTCWMVRAAIANNRILRYLKQKTIEYNLPVLNRKWDKISENYLSRVEKSLVLKDTVMALLKEGKTRHEISKILNMSRYTLNTFMLRYKISLQKIGLRPPNIKKVNQLDLNGGLIKTWDSISEAAKSLDCYVSAITNVLHGSGHTACKFKWEYANV